MGRRKADKWYRGYKLMAPGYPTRYDKELQKLTSVPAPEFDADIVFRYLQSAKMCRDKRLGATLYTCKYVRAVDQNFDEFMPNGTVRVKTLCLEKLITT